MMHSILLPTQRTVFTRKVRFEYKMRRKKCSHTENKHTHFFGRIELYTSKMETTFDRALFQQSGISLHLFELTQTNPFSRTLLAHRPGHTRLLLCDSHIAMPSRLSYVMCGLVLPADPQRFQPVFYSGRTLAPPSKPGVRAARWS